jgi:anti-anti-sigma regulatory factor
MIHIKETIGHPNTVEIHVGGVVDQESIPILKEVCERHFSAGREVVINLESLVHATREGRRYLKQIYKKVTVAGVPEFMKLEQGCQV